MPDEVVMSKTLYNEGTIGLYPKYFNCQVIIEYFFVEVTHWIFKSVLIIIFKQRMRYRKQ